MQADSLLSEPPGVQIQFIMSQFSLPSSSYVSQYTCVAPAKNLHVPHRLFCFSEQRNNLEAADFKKKETFMRDTEMDLQMNVKVGSSTGEGLVK